MNAYSQGDGEIERRFVAERTAMLGQDAWEKESTAGSPMTLDDAIPRARSICEAGIPTKRGDLGFSD